jgi:acyl-CoA synthetase
LVVRRSGSRNSILDKQNPIPNRTGSASPGPGRAELQIPSLDVPPDWQLRVPPLELTRSYGADGLWDDDTLGEILASGLADGSQLTCKVRSKLRPYSGTLGDVADSARRVAGGLHARGVGTGDLVAFQLPNWVEAAATFWATAFLGAVPVPIVHFYGPKEVGFILRESGARVFVTADRFGHLDYLANLDILRPDLPALELVAVVTDDDLPSALLPFSTLADADAITAPARVDPSAPALVAYTSGTTADPKGVVHAHRTIGAEIRQLGAMQAKPGGPPALVGAPVGHGIGMLAALLIPVYRREPIHLIDVWDPSVVLAAMLEDQVYSGAGATFFLTSLLDHPEFTDEHRKLMRNVGLGGSSVPAAVTDRADAMGISIVRMYGSTEHPSITGSRHEEKRDKRLYTDGRPLPGVEIRLLDADGKDVEPGTPGEIHSRGPDCFPGYTDPALTRECFDAEGWYATGDIGVLDDDGYLSIVDRKKDIIIRGGENISALEVEELVLRLPGVAEVAVVAAPDARLGEHACAFVRPLPGQDVPSLDDVRAHLDASGLARQKWPEEIRTIDDFPRTASGKIQKFALRDHLRQEAGVSRA